MKYIYYFSRGIYLKLPFVLQKKLSVVVRRVAQYLRPDNLLHYSQSQLNRPADLSWLQFKKNILDHSNSYRGIFIQTATIDWDVELYQRPQHIAAAFARRGYLVIYQTNNLEADRVDGFRQIKPNLWLTNYNIIHDVPQAVISVYSTIYADVENLIGANRANIRVVYEYIDHIDPKISGDSENLQRLTEQKKMAFRGGADMIVASSAALYQEVAQCVGSEKTLLVQNGVDTAHYRLRRQDGDNLPESYHGFCQNYQAVVGYFGAIAPWLWYPEINRLIKMRPDLGFVFIGPDYANAAKYLDPADNLLCTGAVDYHDLPLYAAKFDACLIPFEPGEIAKTTSPLKLYEYFALEKPVVVTSAMIECTAYSQVFSANNAEEFSAQLDLALQKKNDPVFTAGLATLADQNDWDHRVAIYEKIYQAL